MPAKGKVNVTLQMILTCIPFGDVWTFYRIKKLRRYLIILVPIVLGIGISLNLVLGGPDYYSNEQMKTCMQNDDYFVCLEMLKSQGDWCEPDWLLYLIYNTCDPDELRLANAIFHIGILVFAVSLIRYWSIQWNQNQSKKS